MEALPSFRRTVLRPDPGRQLLRGLGMALPCAGLLFGGEIKRHDP